jgi:hypothetical protein
VLAEQMQKIPLEMKDIRSRLKEYRYLQGLKYDFRSISDQDKIK